MNFDELEESVLYIVWNDKDFKKILEDIVQLKQRIQILENKVNGA